MQRLELRLNMLLSDVELIIKLLSSGWRALIFKPAMPLKDLTASRQMPWSLRHIRMRTICLAGSYLYRAATGCFCSALSGPLKPALAARP